MNSDNKIRNAWTVNENLPVSFTIACSPNIFNPDNKDLLRFNNSDRRLAVIDDTIYKLYKSEIFNFFKSNNIEVIVCEISVSEDKKNWNNANKILEFFETNGVLRREPIIAIGGGILLDLVGFGCAIYRRGIPYIKIPTTLLSIVDASIGTKVAVNHFDRRNRIGSYYPPIASFLDKKFISTQDSRQIANGLSEIFKLAVIKDYSLFELLENYYDVLLDEKFQDNKISDLVIDKSVSSMLHELSPNLWEKILERPVDYGHSFSPIIEMKNVNSMFHGEAVVLDCLFSACLSNLRGLLSKVELDRIFATARKLNLPTYHIDFANFNMLKLALNDTVKHRNGNQHLPLPMGIGNCQIINDLIDQEIYKTIDIFNDYENSYRNRNN